MGWDCGKGPGEAQRPVRVALLVHRVVAVAVELCVVTLVEARGCQRVVGYVACTLGGVFAEYSHWEHLYCCEIDTIMFHAHNDRKRSKFSRLPQQHQYSTLEHSTSCTSA